MFSIRNHEKSDLVKNKMVWILYILAWFLKAAKVILESKRNIAGKAGALISKENQMDSPSAQQ